MNACVLVKCPLEFFFTVILFLSICSSLFSDFNLLLFEFDGLLKGVIEMWKVPKK